MSRALITTRPVVPSFTRVSSDDRDYYWGEVCRLWNTKKQDHFPGSHPMSVEPSRMRLMAAHTYVVSLKTDGTRFLLLMTRRPSAEPVAILCDRARVMYEVEVWADAAFFDGTLLDGEVAWSLSQEYVMHYLVFDVVAVRGANVTAKIFSDRLQIIHQIIFVKWREASDDELAQQVHDEQKIHVHQAYPQIRMSPKPIAAGCKVLDVWNAADQSDVRFDGLVFTRSDATMHIGRTPAILKWKPHHTVDVEVRQRDDNLDAYACTPSGAVVRADSMSPAITSIVVRRNELLDDVELPCIFECFVDDFAAERLTLFPARQRVDKTHPNSMSTILRCLNARTSDVTVQDISKHFEAHSRKRNRLA